MYHTQLCARDGGRVQDGAAIHSAPRIGSKSLGCVGGQPVHMGWRGEGGSAHQAPALMCCYSSFGVEWVG
eukprot:gene15334-biopygen2157